MKPEIEAKFINVNHDDLRAKLKVLGAECVQPRRLMKRKNYDFRDKRLERIGGWVRARDEGRGKVTMSYKQLTDRSLTGTQEIEIVVDNYEKAVAFIEAIGMQVKSVQETKRESWLLGEVQIELDEWPWVKPYLEIEGPDESSVKKVASQLGFDWSAAKHGSVEIVYQAEYDLGDEEINNIPIYRFSDPMPELLAKHRKA